MDYIKKQLTDLGWNDEFKNILKLNHIHYKENEANDLVILFNNYNDLFHSKINQVLRSVVISKKNNTIISYSCATPLENNDGVNYLLRNSLEDNKPIITECYEGTFLSLFNYENKWYLSTRKCLDAHDSNFKEKSYFEMFENVLKLAQFNDFDDFTSKLDQNLNYYFILLDSENINIVDYSYAFGENYHKLVFVYCRDKNQKVIENYNVDFIGDHIIKPKSFTDISYLDEYNEKNQWNIPAKSEGLVVRYPNETLIKLQGLDYQFAKSVGSDNNIYLGMLKMYQLDKLDKYINSNKERFEKITNPLNTSESYLTIGIINSIFRTLTSELLDCYLTLYDNNALPKDVNFYQILPNEYKYFMFKIRGIHFKKLNTKKNLSEKDIYYLIKKIDVEKIYSLLRMRKLMFNLAFQYKFNDSIKKFKMISSKVNKLNLKLVNIYTSKLFPEIMDKDVPDNISLEL